jgi:ceramide glucosyltransferase
MGILWWIVTGLLLLERVGKLWLVVRFFRKPLPPLRTVPARISILQPVLSGDPTMADCLAHNVRVLAGLGAAVEFHWLVDEADPPGQAICRAIMARHPQMAIHLTLLPPAPQSHNPKMVKLLAALPAATGDVICVLDDDTMLPADGLACALPYLDEAGAGLVFGLPYQVDFSNYPSRLVAYFVNSSSLLTYIPYLALSAPLTINGMFYLLRRSTLAAVGDFDGLETILADDFAVAQRVRQAGYRLIQSPLRHAVSNHVVGFGAYWQLLARWLTFPRESLLRHLEWRELGLLYSNTVLPTVLPLLLLVAVLIWPSAALVGLSVGYFLLNYLIFLWLDQTYLYHVSPWRWSWLVPVTQLLLPLQLLTALLLPQRIMWRGHLMQVARGGGFRFVRRRAG